MLIPTSLRNALAKAFVVLLATASLAPLAAQPPTMAANLPNPEMRQPWTRSNERFIRSWQVLGEVPLGTGAEALRADPFAAAGGEAALKPGAPVPALGDAAPLTWRQVNAWGDTVDMSDGKGLKRDRAAYAATTLTRSTAGRARLSIGSDESVRAWINGKLVLERYGPRPLLFDQDQVEVDLDAGENLLLVKLEQRAGPWHFAARVLESGGIAARVQELVPSYVIDQTTLVVTTDRGDPAGIAPVDVEIVAPGGKIVGRGNAARGSEIKLDTADWADGPYEVRCSTIRTNGRRFATHLPWFKGDAAVAARALLDDARAADGNTPAGQTIAMLADMVRDRLGEAGLEEASSAWWAIHSPLLEYAELKLEAGGATQARVRSHGFYRLAWRDEVDGSPQFARAYLPIGYDPARKWPVVLKLHGYNPENPVYVRWWGADSRHSLADEEYGHGEGIIYIEPHGRGNTQYLGFGDQDVVRVLELARRQFSVDEDRVYLCGDSMGGWGTWNVAMRHPQLFAAIAPIYGGVDYHSQLTAEQISALSPLARFLRERESSWVQADALLNMPILVLHGDADRAVNVDWSRYGVRMLQRWGYDVRYIELPGYAHEDLNRWAQIFDWFLTHRRDPNPRHVRIRSAELPNANAYWAAVDAFERPDEFMVVDAAVTAPNTIRVDSRNVAALTLTLPAQLIDHARPVRVVWNGEPQAVSAGDGKVRLSSSGYRAAEGQKSPARAGAIADAINTPFILVEGTTAADPAMREACHDRAEAFAQFWRQWQNQPLRRVTDAELTNEDLARYTLILLGGPDDNAVTRRLGAKLPLGINGDGVRLREKNFPANAVRVMSTFPHPENAARYVLVIAANSAALLQRWSPSSVTGNPFDFVVDDGRVPSLGQNVTAGELLLASGWFNREWKLDPTLVFSGNEAARAKALALRPTPPETVLQDYVARYEIAPGVHVQVARNGRRLTAQVAQQPAVELVPVGAEGDETFCVLEGPMIIVCTRDATGKVVGFKSSQNGNEFAGRRVD